MLASMDGMCTEGCCSYDPGCRIKYFDGASEIKEAIEKKVQE